MLTFPKRPHKDQTDGERPQALDEPLPTVPGGALPLSLRAAG